MKRLWLTSIFVFIATTSLYSQTPTPTPAPTTLPIENDGDVVRITTTLIQIDATVTDKKGNIVRDLKAEDFEIFENNEKQDITNFSFVTTESEPTSEPGVKPSKKFDPINTIPPARIRSENIRRTIALVVDDLSLSFESVAAVRDTLKKFVNTQMQSGDLVAIIRTAGGMGALQQFTNDKRQLFAAIEKVRWSPSGSGGISAFAPIETTLEDIVANESRTIDNEETDRDAAQELNEFRENIFAVGTLGALNYIVRGMKDLPGRKSVMLLSDGFRLFRTDSDGLRGPTTVLDSFRRLTELANRASVVVYTMDARGLQTLGLTAADDVSGLSFEQLQSRLSDRSSQLFDTQEGLSFLARETGGIAIKNNNDLSGGIEKMLNDQKGFYLIGYTPDSDTFDPAKRRFNKLVVKVKRPDLRVRFRSGFFGIADEQVRPSAQSPAQQLLTAITSPFGQTGINVRLNALFGNEEKTGSFVRSFLHVDANDLTFTKQPDGKFSAKFDVLAMAFGENGMLVQELDRTYTFNGTEADVKSLQRRGFVYYFSFPVKKSGGYQYRVAIRDQGSSKVGSANQFVEVPKVKKDRHIVSGLALKNYTLKQWNNSTKNSDLNPDEDQPDSVEDTALRKFKRGTILQIGFAVFNARSTAGQKPDIEIRTRIFRDGKLFYEGVPKPVSLEGITDLTRIPVTLAISLGTVMKPGDYIFQVIVTDKLAKEKRKFASQFVQFEITE